MSSLANARTGTVAFILGKPPLCEAEPRAAPLLNSLLYTVARVAIVPVSSPAAGQPSAPDTWGGECPWLNAACVSSLSNYFQRARRLGWASYSAPDRDRQ